MALHKKSRLRAYLSLSVVLAVVFGSLLSMTSASADDQTETTAATDTPAPKDDSSSEVPAAPETEESSDDASTKVATPKSAPSEEESKSEEPAPAEEETKVSSDKDQPDKVTICHRTASYSNPYTSNSVAQSSVDGDGGNDHGQGDHYLEHTGPVFYVGIPKHTEWGDIIPPIAGVHSGLNWTEAGQAIYNNGCNVPPADTEVTPTVPTSSDVCEIAHDEYTILSKEGVEYLVDGVVKTAGTYPGSGTVVVTAEALPGYKLIGDASWTFTFTNEACPVDIKPTTYTAKCSVELASGVIVFTNPAGNPGLKFTIYDNAQAGAGEKIERFVEGGESSDPVSVDYTSGHVKVETIPSGDDEPIEEYNITIPQDCGEEPGEGDMSVDPDCGFVMVTNNEDESMQFMYGSFKNVEPDGTVDIEAGKTVKVKTKRSSLDYFAYFDKSGKSKQGTVKVKQNCDTPPPSSGIGTPASADRPLPDTGGESLWILPLGLGLALAGAGITVATRRRTSNV